jgi:hypothetical protein
MNLNAYKYTASDTFLDFEFESNGPKGKIRKVVRYSPQNATVLEFTQRFPDVIVYAKGSTPARTRLYQIGISANWSEIEPLLHVFGYEQNRGWVPFKKNVNYDAFLVRRK